jgi:hypothetical protein
MNKKLHSTLFSQKLLRLVTAIVLLNLGCVFNLKAQETINTTIGSTGYTGTNSSGSGYAITFVIANNSGSDILITDMGRYGTTTHNGTTSQLWYSSTSLSGTYGTLAGPTWTMAASQTVSGITTTGVNTFNSGMSLLMPAGETWRFAAYTTGANNYSGTGVGTCTPNTFTSLSGVTMYVGDYQIGGAYVGYGATNNPRFFTGFLTYEVLPNGPNDAGAQEFVSPTLPVCSGTFPVTATIKNYGTNAINPVAVNWSVNGVLQTPSSYTSTLDTAGGTGNNTANVTLGSIVINNVPKTVKIWTSNPNGVADTSNLNDTIIEVFAASLNGTYTIGVTGADYSSLSAAVAALDTFGVCGPTTFLIDDGTYNESITLNSISGASATNTITFKSDPTNTALANQTYLASTTGDNFLWKFNDADYVILDSINMTATGSTYSRVLEYIGLNDFITVKNCNLTGANVVTTSTFNCVVFNNTGTGNLANDCVFENNNVSGGSYQFYWYGGSSVILEDNNKFINNTFTNFYYAGVSSYYQNNCEFIGNYFESAGTYSSTTIGYLLYRYFNDGESHVLGNTIVSTNNGGHAIYSAYCDASPSAPAIIANNFLSNTNSSSTGTIYGLLDQYSSNQKMYHNNISMLSGGASSAGARLYYSSSTYSGNEFVNNIVATYGNAKPIYFYRSGTTILTDYNVYYHPSTTLGYYNSNYNNLPSLQSGLSTELASFVIDPSFVSPTTGNLHIQNLALNGTAIPVGILSDIDGVSRTTVNPDRGADEINGPANDAAAFSFDSPTNPLCGSTINANIVVFNPGSLALNSLTLNWTINGVGQTPYLWSGAISPGSSDTIAIGSAVVSSGDEIVVWTSLPNGILDSNALFDTISIQLFGGLSGTYAIPGDFATIGNAIDSLNLFGACDTVIFSIAPGTYDEPIEIGNFSRVDPTAPVIFMSSTNDSADVIWDNTSAQMTVQLLGADFIWFQDLTIQNSFASGYNVIYLGGGASNNMFERVRMVGVNTTSISNLYSTFFNASGSIDEYNIVQDCRIENGSYGIYNYGSSQADVETGNQFINNEIVDFYYNGCYNYYQRDEVYKGNKITSNSVYTLLYGSSFYYVSGDFDISGNHVYPGSNGTSYFYCGMLISNSNGASFNDRATVENNIIVTGTNDYTGYTYGLWLTGTSLVNVYHNTSIVIDGGPFASALYFLTGNGNEYLNNLATVVKTDTSSTNTNGTGYAMYYSGGAVLDMDHNNYFSNGTTPIYYDGNFSNLSDFQTATMNDMHSLEVEPDFLDTINAVLCDIYLNNAGTPVSTSSDFEGLARNPNTPDIGAREFQSVGGNFLGPDKIICAAEAEEVLSIAVTSGTSVLWQDANSSTLSTTGSITVDQNTSFPVSVLITNQCGSGSDAISLTFVPNVDLAANTHICADDAVVLAPDGNGNPNATYSWFPGGQATAQLNVDMPGAYSVTKSQDGCISQASTIVSKSDKVELTDDEACAATLPYSVDASILGGISYSWNGGNAMTSAVNEFTSSGDYAITASDSFGCATSDTFHLEVIDTPVAVISNTGHSSNLFYLSSAQSQNVGMNGIYTWNFGDGTTSNDANPSHIFPWSGASQTFTVTLTVTNDCGTSETVSMEVTSDPLGINSLEASNSIIVYPNPSNGLITVTGDFASSVNVEVLDMTGRIVKSSNNASISNNQFELNLQDLSKGSYHIKIENDNYISINQIIIQ